MATGAGASGGSLESSLDRKFHNVSNTMDSIQGLSTWCIDNKKYHSLIVRGWMKWLRKSDASHRLNLFYVANDVIQNCKRKNAMVYRTAFAEVLPDAFLLVNTDGDPKVMKSVERILTIWEERGVYSGALITELKGYLVKEESPPETPVEQKTPVDSKAALKSKVVAEFVPQALIDQLSKYKTSVEEVDLREKQLAAMRVDVCSSEALKKLKDKAGGKKFSKDFEEGSAKLQDFVKFLDRQSKGGPPLLEALSNADIFYEMQYQEVKIVANAYQTFANRVSHLKRKLDSLKATLPDLDESPIPSPSADAPSPTGSESPFHGLEMPNPDPDPDLDGSAMDDEAEPPAPSPLSSPGASPKQTFTVGENDNREVEDMELSEDEMESGGIIVEEKVESPAHIAASSPVPAKTEPSAATEQPVTVTQATPTSAAPPASLPSVDLSKIGSLLNSLTSVVKSTGPSVESVSAPATTGPSVKTTPPAPAASQDTSSLVNLLSQVDMTPAELLNALSKAQGQGSSLQGLTSLLSSPAGKVSSDSSSSGKVPPSLSSTPASAAPSMSLSLSSVTPVPSPPISTVRQSPSSQAETPLPTSNSASALVQALHRDMELTTDPEPSGSLESKIHSFLQGNPGFSAFSLGFSVDPVVGGDNLSPVTGTDTQDGTPVRDEGGGTPTQDEVMDKPVVEPFTSNTDQLSTVGTAAKMAPTAYQNNTWQDTSNPQQPGHLQPGVAQNGQGYQPYPYGNQEMSKHGIATTVAHYQQIPTQRPGPVPREGAPGNAISNKTVESFQGVNEGGWYGDAYPEGSTQRPRGYNVATPGGGGENKTGLYPYQADQTREPQGLASQQGALASSGFFKSNLPPVPRLPPPPDGFEAPTSMTGSKMVPPEQQPQPSPERKEVTGAQVDSVIGGMVIHDHQHKSMFHQDDPLFNPDELHRHPNELHRYPDDLRPHLDDLRYQEDLNRYHDDLRRRDAVFHQDDPYRHPEDPYYRPGSPPRYPRGRGRLTPPLSPSDGGAYYAHDYPPSSPSSPPHYAPRRPLPPHPEMRHPGPRPPYRPPHRPPHPAHHPHPRGPPHAPPFPPFHSPDPWLRGKRPGPRGGGPAGPVFAPKRPFLPPRY
ncbi:regulation of nuclear pre-mRNA domain-containing protein 2-like isoform X1 [Centroberyx affinis]|uniref:regulation of nuclear pre-mRNA domain-containing protein 2-like isoform X1 n=2 Tax=Centroberyx affinis TaxID=166261 RepID=UPI003A5C0DA5